MSGAALIGSIGHSGSGAFGRVISLMVAGRLDMSLAATETVPLEEAIDWLARLGDRAAGKVVVLP